LLTGLPIGSSDFSILPPHFDDSNVISEEIWKYLIPYYDDFKATLPFLMASMCYHADWLNDNLYSNHPKKLGLVLELYAVTVIVILHKEMYWRF
jgi:hypothetical protein